MAPPRAFVASVATATPARCPYEHFTAKMNELRRARGLPESVLRKAERIGKATTIESIHLGWSFFHEGTERHGEIHQGKFAGEPGPGEVAVLDEEPTPGERSAYYNWLSLALGMEAAEKALANCGCAPEDVTHVITTSTTGHKIPGLATELVIRLGLPPDVGKHDLFYNGCFNGLGSLRLARDLVRGGGGDFGDSSRRCVLVVAVEVSTANYTASSADDDDIVSISLFGDGAGAVVVTDDGPWEILDSGSRIIENSTSLLSLVPARPSFQDATRSVMLVQHVDKKVPGALADFFHTGPGTDILTNALAILDNNSRSLSRRTSDDDGSAGGGSGDGDDGDDDDDDSESPRTSSVSPPYDDDDDDDEFPALAVHPGGRKILDNLLEVFKKRGWPDTCLNYTYDTYNTHGNTASAAIYFVLEAVFRKTRNDNILGLAMGPGVTVEWMCFQRNPDWLPSSSSSPAPAAQEWSD